MRHDKSCRLQHSYDLLLHAFLLHGMDGDLYYCLDMQSKQIYKVDRCPLPIETKIRKSSFTCAQCILYTHVNADMHVTLKVWMFSEQKDQTPMKKSSPDDTTAFQNASVAVSSKIYI